MEYRQQADQKIHEAAEQHPELKARAEHSVRNVPEQNRPAAYVRALKRLFAEEGMKQFKDVGARQGIDAADESMGFDQGATVATAAPAQTQRKGVRV